MKQYILLLAIISTAGIISCKKDKCQDPSLPYCENYDPCYGEHPTSADFFIYENAPVVPPDGWEYIDTDTIISYVQGASFTPKFPNENYEYTWLIGTETLYDESINRTDFPANENISVSLIVQNNNPNLDCFPNDDGRDTITRTFFARADPSINPKWFGKFRGTYDFLPSETIEFTVPNTSSFFINGLPFTECENRFESNFISFASIQFRIRDVTEQGGRCEEYGYIAFMHVYQDSFYLKIRNENLDIDGQYMRGIKIQ